MRINELIKELERIKSEKGNLLVSIYRIESGDDYSFYNEGSYYNNINLEVVNNTNTNLKKW